ncbi:MAG: chorismate-binding protein [Saprospiraceae bacterium]|nr:chorismate-binding protein [Saprospiraceae bacterium]
MINLSYKDIFAAFKLPGNEDSCLMLQKDEMLFSFGIDSLNSKGFAVYPFDDTQEKSIFIKADESYYNEEFCFYPENYSNRLKESREDYLQNAELFIDEVKSNFKKLVLSRTKSIKTDPGNIYELFKILGSKYPNAFVFLVNHPVTGTWAGASPEILLSGNNGAAKTIALAGTQLIMEGSPILWSNKEIEEQDIVMNYIENTLNQANIEFSSTGPYNKIAAKYDTSNLIHIATEYFFRPGEKAFELLMEMHPTPAVCGLPKKQAFNFITHNEKNRRKYYSGFVGPINHIMPGEFHFYVNLRCMEIFKDEFVLYIGGGINNGSEKEKEWEETENKAKTMETAIKEYSEKIKPPSI